MDRAVYLLGVVGILQLTVLGGVLYLWWRERTELLADFAREREKLMRAALTQQNSPAAAAFIPSRPRDDDRERPPAPIGLN